MAGEAGDVDGHDQLGCRPRPYPRNGEQASVRLVGREQRGYLGGQRLDLGGVLGDSSREQPHGAVLAGHGRRTGLSDDPSEPRGAAALARPRPRVSAPTVCGDVSAIDRGPPTGGA